MRSKVNALCWLSVILLLASSVSAQTGPTTTASSNTNSSQSSSSSSSATLSSSAPAKPVQFLPAIGFELPDLARVETQIQFDGCPSTNLLTCSGNGVCDSGAKWLFGIRETNASRSPHLQRCLCRGEWFGLGCQYSVKQLNNNQKLQLLLAGVLKQQGDSYVASNSVEALPKHSIFAHSFQQRVVNAELVGTNVNKGSMPDINQPRPNTQITRWTTPDERTLMPLGGMLNNLKRERLQMGLRILQANSRPQPTAPRKPVTGSSKFDYYTSTDGETIVAPVMYDDQAGFDMADKTLDAKLLFTLNIMNEQTNQYGAPLTIPLPEERSTGQPQATPAPTVATQNARNSTASS